MAARLLSPRLAGAVAVICAAVAFAFGIRTETPVGSLKGTAIAQESGVPLAADVSLEPTRPWAPENWSFYDTTAGEDGTFVLRNVPTGTYWLRMRSKAHTFRETKINIVEGQTQVIEAELEPNEPYLSLYVHEYVFMPGESPQIVCEGFVDASAIDVKLYKVDLDKFLLGSSHGSLPQFLGSRSGYMDYAHESRLDLSANKSLQPAGAVSTPITKRDAEGVFTQRVTMPALGPGLYVVAVKSAGIQKLDWLMVTSLGMIAKTAGGKTLIYSVDLKTGSPVPSAKVGIYIGSTPVASAVTGPDGLATTSVPVGTDSQSSQVIIGRSGESLAFITAELNSTTTSNKEVYSYTDRPVYRPGQTVYYKGIVRNRTDDTYRTPSPEPVTVEVTDPNETLIYRGTKRTDRFGSYFGSLHLDSEAPTGYYSVRTSVGGKELGEEKGTGFSVSAYRKPEFSVKISFDKRRYTRGDWVTAKVSVNYYFGSPVANAHLYYSVQRSPYWLFENEGYYEGEGYSDYGGYGEWVQDGELWTDANGEANISFPATWSQPTSRDTYDTDQEFQVSVDASDKAGAQATGEGSVIATRGEFAIDVKPDARITKPGATVEVKLTAKDYDRHPVKNKSITVVLARETWSEEDEESVTHDLVTREVTTDDAGRASVRLPIKNSGSLLVTARSRDSRGNTIVSTEYLWSCGDGERCDFGPVSDVQVVADKRQYSPGETAKVLVLTNKPGGTALVTLEGSRVYAAKTVPLRGKSSTVQFNVAKDYGPNFYIAVSYLHDKQVMSHETRARVSMGSEALRVKIEPSAKRYKPGQKASYAVKVTDSKGRPVSAQLSMGVVDEAIYAIQEDNTTPILDYFYSHRDNQVETYDSIPRIYLSDPDKAGAPLKDQPVKIRVRKRFLDTAYWNPAIVTNSDGEARVSFDLPDNLTTWRATVRGITEGTMCGQATNTVISRQDMLVRLEMPRFLVQRDRTMLTAVVHNYTSKDQRVKVRLRAPGLHIDGTAHVEWQPEWKLELHPAALDGELGRLLPLLGKPLEGGGTLHVQGQVEMHGTDIHTLPNSLTLDAQALLSNAAVRLPLHALRMLAVDSASSHVTGDMHSLKLDHLAGKLYGGTLHGNAVIQPADKLLHADVAFDNISAQPLVEALSNEVMLSGTLGGQAKLSAQVSEFDRFPANVQIDGRFQIKQGVLGKVDLVQAASNPLRGGNKGGQTRFDELSGLLSVDGSGYHFKRLKISSGALDAAGRLDISPQLQLNGTLDADLKGTAALVSMPFTVSGTVRAPVLLPSGSTLAGAAVGTALLGPGLGTALGIKFGSLLHKLFGTGNDQSTDQNSKGQQQNK